ncbi:TetR family transcriptional regulator [Propionibacteriaceae bacterium ES.041]|nr:TetR family transcriptional regulator [Enemella evansiae]PFG67001.1 TetR family transcriptional regulator [Propionibacteriaceae bacterium ES.041]
MMNKSRGRPRGGGNSAEAIRAAAHRLFLDRGYRGTTLRAVATEAGVDVAAIGYHFGSKAGLFAAAMALRISPSGIIRGVLAAEPRQLGPALVAAAVDAWEDPRAQAGIAAMIGAAASQPEVAAAVAAYLEQELITPLVEYLRAHGAGESARSRAVGLVTLAAGALVTRYLIEVPSVAALDRDQLVRALAVPARAVLDGR